MQNPKRTSYCSAIRSEMILRHSYPTILLSSDKEQIQISQVDVEKLKRHPSNTSLSSHDSGVGFSKADYEIQRAVRAQRARRPYIIVLHKGKPMTHTTTNKLDNHDEFEANIVVAAATASKRNRREIAVVQKRQTTISLGNNYYNKAENFSFMKNNSAPNLTMEPKEQKEILETKDQASKLSATKHKLFKSVSLSIRKLMSNDKEKKRRSQLIQQIHGKPKKFF